MMNNAKSLHESREYTDRRVAASAGTAKLTGYQIATEAALPAATDTVNQAVGKLAKTAEVNTATIDTKTNLAVMAPAYSADSTYALGVYCVYGDVLYRCTTAIGTPEVWTSGHWTAEPAGTALAEHSTQLAQIPYSVGGRQIRAITLATDVASVTISTDDNSETFALFEALVLVDSVGSSGDTLKSLFYTANGEATQRFVSNAIAAASEHRYSCVHFKVVGGKIIADCAEGATTLANVNGSVVRWNPSIISGNTITSITLTPSAGGVFRAGSTIWVGGRNAL